MILWIRAGKISDISDATFLNVKAWKKALTFFGTFWECLMNSKSGIEPPLCDRFRSAVQTPFTNATDFLVIITMKDFDLKNGLLSSEKRKRVGCQTTQNTHYQNSDIWWWSQCTSFTSPSILMAQFRAHRRIIFFLVSKLTAVFQTIISLSIPFVLEDIRKVQNGCYAMPPIIKFRSAVMCIPMYVLKLLDR